MRYARRLARTLMPQKSVHQLLDDIRLLGDAQYELVEGVRALVAETIPGVTEDVKYGGILFAADVMFAGVFAYRKHVSVEFSHGASIDEPFGHLEGAGKGRRHLKLHDPADIKHKQLAVYLSLALDAARKNA